MRMRESAEIPFTWIPTNQSALYIGTKSCIPVENIYWPNASSAHVHILLTFDNQLRVQVRQTYVANLITLHTKKKFTFTSSVTRTDILNDS